VFFCATGPSCSKWLALYQAPRFDKFMKQNRATLFGLPNSAEAYDLRDFLKRSGFPFEWIDLKTEDDAR
jgi:hypothetical protein